ncbi:MAG: DUF1246 domain-containing protein [Candidatus Saliniplasma sp.]
MIDIDKVRGQLNDYDLDDVKVGVIASHSELDVCDGAVDEGFPSLAVCIRGKERMSIGRRLVREIQRGIQMERLEDLLP